MIDEIVWLHLSDLHMHEQRSGYDSYGVLSALIDDLRYMQKKNGLRPDLIFFTGDVCFGQTGSGSGHTLADQYQKAREFFDQVRESFRPEVAKADFFLIPGNHDVDRGRIGLDTTDWLDHGKRTLDEVLQLIGSATSQWRNTMGRLEEYRNFLQDNHYDHLLADPERLCYTVRREIRGMSVAVVGLNSAWSCGRDGEKGRLWLGGPWQVGKHEPEFVRSDIRIALMHHPVDWFHELEAPRLRPLLQRHFEFFLHGHEHQGWVEGPNPDGHTRIAASAC
jgi:predicted MPP superfamily phosphohydrolase